MKNIKRTFVYILYVIMTCFFAYLARFLILKDYVGKCLNNPDGFLYLTTVKNRGAAFGLFDNSGMFLVVVASAVVLFILLRFLTAKFYISEKKCILLSCLSAGIIGNAFERYYYGFVLDFIKVNLWNFPVFNINDILITIPVFILIIEILIRKKDEYFNDKEVEEDIYLDE